MALPYELLTLGLNAFVLIVALVVVAFVRGSYMEIIETLFPQIEYGSMMSSVLLGIGLFVIVSFANMLVIYRKMMRIWWRKDV